MSTRRMRERVVSFIDRSRRSTSDMQHYSLTTNFLPD